MLTARLLERLPPGVAAPADRVFFLGGTVEDYATQERITGFRDALSAGRADERIGVVRTCGYHPHEAENAITDLYEELGRLPTGLFVNSITAFEGVVRFFKSLPPSSFDDVAIGCFDWNPFAMLLPFPVVMVAQNVERMIEEAFKLMEARKDSDTSNSLVSVPPRLIEPERRVCSAT